MALPTLNKFLCFFPLPCGSFFTLIWTLVRTSAVCFFVFDAIPKIFTKGFNNAFANYVLVKPDDSVNYENYFEDNGNLIYKLYMALLVSEVTLLGYTIFNLGSGLYYKFSSPVCQYLICRFVVWIVELCILFILSYKHPILLGWYLILQMVIILEFYGVVIVYSYCQRLYAREKIRENNCSSCKS